MKFDLGMLLKITALVPYVIAGIEKLHQDAPGSTKQKLAHDALSLASGVADVVLTGQNQQYAAISSQIINQQIDAMVLAFNTAGIFSKKLPAPALVETSK